MSDDLRVLIADDHPLFRKGMRTLLDSMPDVAVAGEATSGAEAVVQAAATHPDLVLMDLQMPDGGGLSNAANHGRAAGGPYPRCDAV